MMRKIVNTMMMGALCGSMAALVSCDSNTPLNAESVADTSLPDLPDDLTGKLLEMESTVLAYPFEVNLYMNDSSFLSYDDFSNDFYLTDVAYTYTSGVGTRALEMTLYDDDWEDIYDEDADIPQTVLAVYLQSAMNSDTELNDAVLVHAERFASDSAQDVKDAINNNSSFTSAGLIADVNDNVVFILRDVTVDFYNDESSAISRVGLSIGWLEDEELVMTGYDQVLNYPSTYEISDYVLPETTEE